MNLSRQLNIEPNKCAPLLVIDDKPAYFCVAWLDVFNATMFSLHTGDLFAASVEISERRSELTSERAWGRFVELYHEDCPIIALWIEHRHCQHLLIYMIIDEAPQFDAQGMAITKVGYDIRPNLPELLDDDDNPLVSALLKSIKAKLN